MIICRILIPYVVVQTRRFASCEALSSLNMVKRKKEEFKISMNE